MTASPRSVPVQVVCGCGHQYDKQANRGSASDPRALLSFPAGCVAVPSRVAARIVATVLQDRVCRVDVVLTGGLTDGSSGPEGDVGQEGRVGFRVSSARGGRGEPALNL